MSARRIIGAVGRTMIGLGLLLLLFVAYQLWGTGLTEASHQAALRTQFAHELAQDRHHDGTTTTSSPGGTATTSPGGTATTTPGETTTTGSDTATIGPTLTAPSEGQPIGELKIPKIGLDKVVVEGTGTDDLRLGPGHYIGTPMPGQPGNAAIAGHRTTYGAPFYNLDQLRPGDPIDITTVQGSFVYVVTGTTIVSPSDNTVLDSTSRPTLTLTTCNPRWSSSQRLVVQAALSSTTPAAAPTPVKPHDTSAAATADLAGAQGSAGAPIAWGVGLAGTALLVWMLAHRRRRKWLLYAVGAVPVLVVMFFFFASISPLLPASF